MFGGRGGGGDTCVIIVYKCVQYSLSLFCAVIFIGGIYREREREIDR